MVALGRIGQQLHTRPLQLHIHRINHIVLGLHPSRSLDARVEDRIERCLKDSLHTPPLGDKVAFETLRPLHKAF
jgi:hypothetical protein